MGEHQLNKPDGTPLTVDDLPGGANNPQPVTKFHTPYEQYADREGQEFELVRTITEPDATHDAEVLPMYVIRFSDGVEIEAWPEEVGR